MSKEKINKVEVKSGTVRQISTPNYPALTPKQSVKKISQGTDFIHKGADIHSVKGKHIRTNPDDKKSNNLVPKK